MPLFVPRVRVLPLALAVGFLVATVPSLSANHVWPHVLDPEVHPVANVDVGRGSGLWVHDGFAYSSAEGSGTFSITDVRDPTAPVLLKTLPLRSRDVDVFKAEDDRTIAVLAHGGPYIHFVDVSDPANATHLSTIALGAVSHNVAALRGAGLVYNSRSGADGIDIIDASVPEAPVLVKVWKHTSRLSCHDVTVYPEEGRAYCAALWETYILDITDPLEPSVIATIDHPDIYIHHWAVPSPDRTVLIVGDEAAFGQHDGCEDSTTLPIMTLSEPYGAVTFYDITNESSPQRMGHVSMPERAGTWCTAHFGDFLGDAPIVAVGWYVQGTVLITWEGPAGFPRIVDHWRPSGAYTWDVRYWDGHLFTGDINRGMDVLRIDWPLVDWT